MNNREYLFSLAQKFSRLKKEERKQTYSVFFGKYFSLNIDISGKSKFFTITDDENRIIVEGKLSWNKSGPRVRTIDGDYRETEKKKIIKFLNYLL